MKESQKLNHHLSRSCLLSKGEVHLTIKYSFLSFPTVKSSKLLLQGPLNPVWRAFHIPVFSKDHFPKLLHFVSLFFTFPFGCFLFFLLFVFLFLLGFFGDLLFFSVSLVISSLMASDYFPPSHCWLSCDRNPLPMLVNVGHWHPATAWLIWNLYNLVIDHP